MSHPNDARAHDYRTRLLAGMAEAITELGYGDVTLAEVVRRARVSKRTFYEHFESKEACLLALYEGQGAWLVQEIEAAIQAAPPGEARIAAGVAVYLSHLESSAGLVRTLFVDIHQLGARGLEARRRVMQRFAALLLREIRRGDASTVHAAEIATALVGGINELILHAVETDRIERLSELAGAVVELVRGFVDRR